MSYIPTNPYYAWVYLKIGLFEATPIPPEHLISLEVTRGPGSGGIQSVKTDEKGRAINVDKSSINTDVFSSCKIALFDETALRVEAQVILGRRTVQLCYGYVNGPRSPLINLEITKSSTSFTRAGSATLTLNLVSSAAMALKTFDYYSYEGLTLNEIVESIRQAYGWGGGIEAGTIAPIKDVTETKWVKDETDPNKYHEIKDYPKTFIRMNQNPIEFLQYEIAPYCVTKEGGYGDYRLWFDDPVAPSNNSIEGRALSDISNAVSDFFKGFLTKLTDPLMKEINKALGEILGWVAESLASVQELIGTLGESVSDAMSKLSSSLGNLQGVAKQAIASLALGGLSGLTQNLTASLTNAGMNMIKGAVGGILDNVTNGLTNQIGSLTGLGGMLGELLNRGGIGDLNSGLISGLVNSLTGGLGLSLTKLNELTNLSMLSIDSLNKFKNSGKFARAMNNNLSMSGSVMYFRPILIKTESGPVSSNYFFDVGSTGGKEGESSVLDFSYTEPGGILNLDSDAIGKDILLSAINIEDGGIIISGDFAEEFVEAKNTEGAKQLQEGRVTLALSSDTPEGLERLSASLLALYRRQQATKATMRIFGDPSIKMFEKCQVTVMTKMGQIHYSSGFYMITKVTDNIQGGVFTTSLELMRHPDEKDVFNPSMIQGGAIGGVFEREAIDSSKDAEINESREDANKNVEDRIEDILGELYEQDEYGNYRIKE